MRERNSGPLECHPHVPGVVPQLLREQDEVIERLPVTDRFDALTNRLIDSVTFSALCCPESSFAPPGIARCLKVARGEEIGEQVRCLLGSRIG